VVCDVFYQRDSRKGPDLGDTRPDKRLFPNMKVIILLLASVSCLLAREVTPIEATVSRVPGATNELSYKIEYKSTHEAKLGVERGMILQQQLVCFYNNGTFVGSYYYFRDMGSSLPSAITMKDLHAKPKHFDEIRVKDLFYDISWRDGHATEAELGRWFSQAWHLFNSCEPNTHEYHLCKVDDIPRMDGFIEGAGFKVYGVLCHTFTIPAGKPAKP
jgi:hypothetical protein